ncbi:hypothetical protein [Actinopolymorpha sp. B9G3]|uniref:hypothetical protein n=1 Tax=Actinopolymorpha sp. B9G3 TaxID=3158970 RepID=UPI0032D911B0
MTDETGPTSAIGSPVLAKIRSQVPEFEEPFQRELDAEGPEMGAFQGMSVFAGWLRARVEASPAEPDVQRAFRVVEEVASSDDPMGHPMGRLLVTEFVEALRDNPCAVALMGSETLRFG